MTYHGARDLDAGRRAADELTARGVTATAVRLDVTDRVDAAASISEITARFGRLDILINNAGRIVETAAVETTADDLRAVFDTNVFGTADTIRAALPLLSESGAPRIVNVSSTTGSLALTASGTNFGGDADRRLAYATSKAAMSMLTVQYHRAFQHDPALRHVKINSATPGYTATAMNHGKGTRTVEEGPRIIVRLALLPDDGPSGGFFNDDGPVPW